MFSHTNHHFASLVVVEDDDVGREERGVDGGGAVPERRPHLRHQRRLLPLEGVGDVLRQGEDLPRPVDDLIFENEIQNTY